MGSYLTEKEIRELYNRVFYEGHLVYEDPSILGGTGRIVQFARATELKVMQKLVRTIASYLSGSNSVHMTSHLTEEEIHELHAQIQGGAVPMDNGVQFARAIELEVMRKLVEAVAGRLRENAE